MLSKGTSSTKDTKLDNLSIAICGLIISCHLCVLTQISNKLTWQCATLYLIVAQGLLQNISQRIAQYIWLFLRDSNSGTYHSAHLPLSYSSHHVRSPFHQRGANSILSPNQNLAPGQIQDRNGLGSSSKCLQSDPNSEPPPNQTSQCCVQTRPDQEGQRCQTIQSSSSLVTDVWHLSFDWCKYNGWEIERSIIQNCSLLKKILILLWFSQTIQSSCSLVTDVPYLSSDCYK